MSLGSRDRRALVLLGVAAVLMIVYRLASTGDAPEMVAPVVSPEAAERRLARVRELALQVPSREEAFRKVSTDVAAREKGLIQADTAAQAQAQLLQILRRLTRAQAPPIEIRSVEIGQVRPYGEQFGEVTVSIALDCRIEQLVQLLADITAQPELLSTSEIRASAVSGKEKTMPARLTVGGLVPRRLIPEKRL